VRQTDRGGIEPDPMRGGVRKTGRKPAREPTANDHGATARNARVTQARATVQEAIGPTANGHGATARIARAMRAQATAQEAIGLTANGRGATARNARARAPAKAGPALT
jgi:hypothetical protein